MTKVIAMGDLSEHFSKFEFACKCGKCGRKTPSKKLIDFLESLRIELDHNPIIITPNGGVRCNKQNRKVGGAFYSQHLTGNAADIVVYNYHPNEVAKKAEKILGWTGGVGRYRSFTHVDVRKFPARWWSK